MRKGAHSTQLRFVAHDHWTMRSLPIDTAVANSSTRYSVLPLDPNPLGSIEGLRMAQDFHHLPVLREEVLSAFAHVPAGVVIDATLGGAGHAAALLESRSDLAVLGIDRDPVARQAATAKLASFGDRAKVVAGTFGDMANLVSQNTDWLGDQSIVGVTLDLGVSSPQLDDATRGFSFRANAPLDMRMDQTTGLTAAEFLAQIEYHDLVRLLREHGEQRFAGPIARSILESQPQTTTALVDAVERAVPIPARRRGHVATRTFQALRVAVNNEEAELLDGLAQAIEVLAPGGALVVIAYHSGEDHVVKNFLREGATGGCTCPVMLGCVCGAQPRLTLSRNGAVMASPEELERNPRARSARLRYALKVAA